MIGFDQARPPHEERDAMPQGTIKDFDIQTGAGTVVLDDRVEVAFDTQTFLDSNLEELRLGQRVRFQLDGDRVSDLQLISL
jgi:cold shock CspA family protein